MRTVRFSGWLLGYGPGDVADVDDSDPEIDALIKNGRLMPTDDDPVPVSAPGKAETPDPPSGAGGGAEAPTGPESEPGKTSKPAAKASKASGARKGA